VAGLAGQPGAVFALGEDVGLIHGALGIAPGYAAGDLIVHVAGGVREIVLRRQAGSGLTVIADQARVPGRGGVR
jgi:hypothetical protein